jgi:general L-amino acid transport system permease protein
MPGTWKWMRANLFNSWLNSIITLAMLALIVRLLAGLVGWALDSQGWPAIVANLKLFWVGQYPSDAVWRVEVSVWIVALLLGLSAGIGRGIAFGLAVAFGGLLSALAVVSLLLPPSQAPTVGIIPFLLPGVEGLVGSSLSTALFLVGTVALIALGVALGTRFPKRLRWPTTIGWLLSFPFIMLVLVHGVSEDGPLRTVETNLWGGLLVTMSLTIIGIVASFPLGVLLALGRRSNLPVVKFFSTFYIEVVRGVPLITVFFMAQLMLPLFLPANVRVDNLVRAMVAVVLFSAAYLAENVRGGLQSIPRGQTEAAYALGLGTVQTILLITLPQALRAVIPALVGQFISLFKDTSLVTIIGLFDLLGISQFVVRQPAWLGIPGGVWREVYVFIALVYFVFSFTMSRVSLRIERNLGVGQR